MALVFPFTLRADIVVIVNKDNAVSSMSKSQIIDLFMGRYRAYPDGRRADPIDNGVANLKQEFYGGLTGMTLARVNAYWSRVRFTGRTRPPIQLKNSVAVANFVAKNPKAIAYIEKKYLNSELKVVYRFDK